jgi:hypothetical protein
LLALILDFIEKLETIYTPNFPRLGTFLSYFSNDLFPNLEFQPPELTIKAKHFLSDLLSDYYDGQNTHNLSLIDIFLWGSFGVNAAFESM